MKHVLLAMTAMSLACAPATLNASPAPAQNSGKPTIILVHGAFAESASWNGVVADLLRDGYRVIAAANPLRGVKEDSRYISDLTASVPGPVVLVGHSYGGSVISTAAEGRDNVKALVFVAAFAPAIGESAASLSAKFPTGTLGPTLAPPVPLAGGGADLYIKQDQFRSQFAADISAPEAAKMAATQRPIAQSALGEAATAEAWRHIPSRFIYGTGDKNIPSDLSAFLAKRANSRETVAIPGASHVVMISHPHEVAKIIERAASER